VSKGKKEMEVREWVWKEGLDLLRNLVSLRGAGGRGRELVNRGDRAMQAVVISVRSRLKIPEVD
jgi:hypothetical protein